MTDFWTEWRSAALAAGGDVLVMGATDTSASASLHSQGVTPDSAIGTFAQHCGAVLVDGGWLRLLGAGVPGLPGLHRANQSPAESPTAPFVVAVDVLAGVFAVNGGSIPDAAPVTAYVPINSSLAAGSSLGESGVAVLAMQDAVVGVVVGAEFAEQRFGCPWCQVGEDLLESARAQCAVVDEGLVPTSGRTNPAAR